MSKSKTLKIKIKRRLLLKYTVDIFEPDGITYINTTSVFLNPLTINSLHSISFRNGWYNTKYNLIGTFNTLRGRNRTINNFNYYRVSSNGEMVISASILRDEGVHDIYIKMDNLVYSVRCVDDSTEHYPNIKSVKIK